MDASDSLAGCSICLNYDNQGQSDHCDVGLNYNVDDYFEPGNSYQDNQGGQSQQGICVNQRVTNLQTICRDLIV